jgi:hypothetical protein
MGILAALAKDLAGDLGDIGDWQQFSGWQQFNQNVTQQVFRLLCAANLPPRTRSELLRNLFYNKMNTIRVAVCVVKEDSIRNETPRSMRCRSASCFVSDFS